jgi:hypothetical protein
LSILLIEECLIVYEIPIIIPTREFYASTTVFSQPASEICSVPNISPTTISVPENVYVVHTAPIPRPRRVRLGRKPLSHPTTLLIPCRPSVHRWTPPGNT